MIEPGRAALLGLIVLSLLFAVGAAVAVGQTEDPPSDPESVPASDPAEETTVEPKPPPEESEPELTPRARYNQGLDRFLAGDRESATEAFLQARDEAGPDPELRYRAAFNLGVALAGQADGLQEDSPEEAIELLRQASAWFNDAIRLVSEEDDDARVNLELVLRRIQQLADKLNKGKKLEARLDRVIDDQRGLRDGVRRLLQVVEAEGVSADPLVYQNEFEDLATLERVLQAETGNISDLADEEHALLEETPEEERNDQVRFRLVQLQNLDYYLQQARQSLSDSRRRLRRLEGERAHRRADTALAELKRAREQLQDPIAVLKSLVQDETVLLKHTQGLELLRGGGIRLDDDRPMTPPSWLNLEHLTERQQTLALRTDEVLARLQAGIGAADQPQATEEAQAIPPEQQRMLDAAREAVPHIEEAREAMAGVLLSIPAEQLGGAVEDQARSIQALLLAIEQFAGVRELIELAYADQAGVVQLLTPPDARSEEDSPLADLSTKDRIRLVREVLESNRDRLARLQGLLEDEREQTEAQVAQGADPDAATPADPSQLEAIGQKYDLAEQLRTQAADHLEQLASGLARVESGDSAGSLRDPAGKTLADLEELRRIFFSLVEHLKELLRNQTETHDATATLQFEADAEGLDVGLAPAAEMQASHAEIGEVLAQAVARQADAAGESAEEGAQEAAQTLAEAAGEVQGAAARMEDASSMLAEATAEFVETSSPDLEPVLEHQLEAMEHLENAIRLLEPPQQKQQDQQQQPQQQQPQPQPEEDEMSQRQAQRRLQAIRDREAERQRRKQQAQQTEPVEKDW